MTPADDRFTVGWLLAELGYECTAGDLDDALRWALVELWLRRAEQ